MSDASTPPPQPSSQEVLAEAVPDSLDELFSRDPFTMSVDDFKAIAAALRVQRANWKIDEAKGARKPAKPAKPAAGNLDVSLKDLGLE